MPMPFNGNPYADYSDWNNCTVPLNHTIYSNPTYSNPYAVSQNMLTCYIVHGAEEAERYVVPLNSTVMLMDYNSAMFWIKKCDSIGQVTMTPYTFQELNQNSQLSDMQSVLNRLSKLEAKFNESNISITCDGTD